jgi:3-hydroxyacyl-[acyl-carrier-protein] dehydratase
MIKTPLMIEDILARLPHRYPFLMIDRVLECDAKRAVALKNVSYNEPYFTGHFPTVPMMPGVLMGEAMAQTAAFIGANTQAGTSAEAADLAEDATDAARAGAGTGAKGMGDRAFLTNINLKLAHPVVPGDQLVLTATLVKRLGKLMKILATAKVGHREVASAEISVAMV